MAAAPHAAQRNQYSLPPPANDDLRLPSIKDLKFHYPPRPGPQPSSEPPSAYEHGHPQPQDRSSRHSQPWQRQPQPPPHPISYPAQAPPPQSHSHPSHPQQNISPPPPPVAHDPPPKATEYSGRYDIGYATPGVPLSAQTAPVPGSVNSGPAVRSEEYHSQTHNKRARTGDRTPVIAHRDTRPSAAYSYTSYNHAAMPPPSPYHQSSPSAVQSPVHPTHPPHASPSPHETQHPTQPPVQQYGSYHHHQYPPVRPTNVSQSGPPPPPPVQNPTPHAPAPMPPPPPPPQSTHVLAYAPSAPSSTSQEWQAPPPQPPQHFHHHHHPPPHLPPPSGPPAPSTPTLHHTPHHHQYQQHTHPQSHPPHPPPQSHPPTSVPPAPAPPPPQPQSQPVHYPPLPPPNLPPPAQQTHPPATAPAPQSYPKPASINPAELDTRGHYPHNLDTSPPPASSPDPTMSELVNLCSILYDFASRYSQLHGSVPGPAPHEIIDMAARANQVVQLLEELRRPNESEGQRAMKNDPMGSPEDHRPPKRPWEDMAEEGQDSPDESNVKYQQEPYPNPPAPQQSTAEQDMELIRTKRATTTAGAAASTGQPKSKYRKRSQRASPPGKCHSCNIRETPEWRRGPDGARTLCNACGLHYAKLMRKQNKQHPGPNGEPPPPIDMDTLRASTRAAEAEKAGRKDEGSPTGAPTHHQGSFQVMTMAPVPVEPQSTASPTTDSSSTGAAPVPAPSSTSILQIPPPPWSSPSVTGRGYATGEQLQHQSFVRSSIPTNSPR
ncbi:hypothetical protein AAF712_005069 [Marasmius tenuissimus]|uniref:GATA-type domain-containing protein n=1 Tax=Marasmius tenuissimus TaxID=585030 RepID=A0ABR3A1Z6_9AGAR|nr:hypothetical protein PM082_016454 [Marasmius tenuissimus]